MSEYTLFPPFAEDFEQTYQLQHEVQNIWWLKEAITPLLSYNRVVATDNTIVRQPTPVVLSHDRPRYHDRNGDCRTIVLSYTRPRQNDNSITRQTHTVVLSSCRMLTPDNAIIR